MHVNFFYQGKIKTGECGSFSFLLLSTVYLSVLFGCGSVTDVEASGFWLNHSWSWGAVYLLIFECQGLRRILKEKVGIKKLEPSCEPGVFLLLIFF